MCLKLNMKTHKYIYGNFNELSNVNTLRDCKLCSRSRTSKHSFVSVYRVYSVSTDTILMWIFEVQYNIQSRWFTIDYLCVLFVRDDIIHRPQRIIR
jgi:hypothetical protein